MFGLSIKKDKEEQKTYKKFQEERLQWMAFIANIDTEETIGLSDGELRIARENGKKRQTEETYERYFNLLKKLNSMELEEEFKSKLFTKMDFIMNYGTFEKIGEETKGFYHSKDSYYYLSLNIEENKISFESNTPNKKLTGLYEKKDNFSYTKYEEVEKSVFCSTPYSINEINGTQHLHVFDKENIEIFDKRLEAREKLLENTETGIKLSPQASPFDNYVETNYRWRAEDYILEHQIKKYAVKGEFAEDRNNAFIAYNKSDDNRLPKGGEYFGFKTETLQDYFAKKKVLKDIFNEVAESRKGKPHIHTIDF